MVAGGPKAGKAARAGRIGGADSRGRVATVPDAKLELLRLLASNLLEPSLAAVGRSLSTYNVWRREDADFRAECDYVIGRRKGFVARRPVPAFGVFAEQFLHEPLFWHQQQWVDVLEGREPSNLHGSQVWEPGDPDYLLINTPPAHGKSTTITQNYVTWRIVQEPNLRVIVVSKSQGMARDFLYAIKERLSGPRYRELQHQFGPAEGWEASADQWAADQIVLGEKDDGQKDPTVQVLGLGGQIYGARADLIILDDCVTLSNAGQSESQLRWLAQEVQTRLGANGTLLVVGTRVASEDLYSLIRKTFVGEWSYLTQPAVLESAGDPSGWVTLWPRSTVQCGCKATCRKNGTVEAGADGLFPKWDGPHLARLRARMTPDIWARAYMQADVAEDSIFRPDDVQAALNRQRTTGLLDPGVPGSPAGGMQGLYVLCSMDPALTGACASVAMAVDPGSGRRWVLDLHNQMGMSPASIHDHIRRWTEKYEPREWRIEKNAMQGMLTQDEELRQFLSARGCRLVEHFTGGNKWDADFGVAAMAPLFMARPTLIDVPANRVLGGSAVRAVDELVTQLISWQPRPEGGQRRVRPGTTDLVMALWFAEIRARELIVGRRSEASFRPNRFATRRGRALQRVVDIDEALEQHLAVRVA